MKTLPLLALLAVSCAGCSLSVWAQSIGLGDKAPMQFFASNSVPVRDLVQSAVRQLMESGAQRTRFTRYDKYHLTNQSHNGKVIFDQVDLYEDTWINNLQYEHLRERNGKPLIGDALADEDARYEAAIHDRKRLALTERAQIESRRAAPLKLQIEQIAIPTYQLTEVGHESVNGYSTRVVIATPASGQKAVKFTPRQRFKVWIFDGPDPFIVKFEFEFLSDEANFRRGTRGEEQFQLFDGVPVLHRRYFHAYMPSGKELLTVDAENIYSGYRRFKTSVTILPAESDDSLGNPGTQRIR